jgi:Zn-dependent peptidase ImmA (M78 family)
MVTVANSIWEWVGATIPLSENNRANFELWKSGEKEPTFNQLEKFSAATHIPMGYFFLNSPPTEKIKILEYRTVDSIAVQNPSRDLIDTVRQMENVQEWMREYVINTQGEKVSFVGSLNSKDDLVKIVSAIRKVLSLPVTWYENSQNVDYSFKILRTAMSSIGIVIMLNGIVGANTHRKLNIEEFRAFTLIDDFSPLIFINSADSKGGLLFSLLHEFVHIGIGASSFFNAGPTDANFINSNEVICNAVAAEIIVPLQVFRQKWSNESGDVNKKIVMLASYFKCSQTVIARRALDSKLISNNEYTMIVSQAKQLYENKHSNGGDFYKTNAIRIDHRFLLALDSSLREGRTLFSDAFHLTNTNRSTFDNLVNEVRGEQ